MEGASDAGRMEQSRRPPVLWGGAVSAQLQEGLQQMQALHPAPLHADALPRRAHLVSLLK